MASNYIFQENGMFLSVSRVSLLYVFLCITISMCVVNGYLPNTHCLTMSAPWAKAPKKHLWGCELSKRLISTWVRVQQVQKSGLWFERLRRLFVLLINTVVVEFCFHVLSLLLPAEKNPIDDSATLTTAAMNPHSSNFFLQRSDSFVFALGGIWAEHCCTFGDSWNNSAPLPSWATSPLSC